jgi:hypothetical protein
VVIVRSELHIQFDRVAKTPSTSRNSEVSPPFDETRVPS